MPYDGEFATYGPLRRLVQSARVKELLGSYEVRSRADWLAVTDDEDRLELSAVKPSDWQPSWVLAIDGSYAEVKVENGFPGAEAAYVTVASVLVDLNKVNQLDQNRPADPREFRTTEQTDAIDCALPGCNVVTTGESSAPNSLRRAMFDLLGDARLMADGESLLTTYEWLMKDKPTGREPQKCPVDSCPKQGAEYTPGKGQYLCNCSFQNRVYSSDALRIHEGMNPIGSNGAMFAEIMQVLERLWLVHILRSMEAKQMLELLDGFAFVIDGPLALFSYPAWLSKAISKELLRLNNEVKKVTGRDLLIIGIEKTGAFVEHFAQLDEYEGDGAASFPRQTAALLTDRYIKANIIFNRDTKLYGEGTYFGRKFFYKTRAGARIVAMLPFLREGDGNTRFAEPDQYPRLEDAMGVLDQLVSSRYPNALSPLVSANAQAAIPLKMGNRVLEQLAKEMMGKHKR